MDIAYYIVMGIGIVIFCAGIYTSNRRIQRAVWKIIFWINDYATRHKEPPINVYEADESWYGEIFLKGANAVARKHGGKDIIDEAEANFEDFSLVIDGKKLFNKAFVKKLILHTEERMLEQSKVKKILYGMQLNIDKERKKLQLLEDQLQKVNKQCPK